MGSFKSLPGLGMVIIFGVFHLVGKCLCFRASLNMSLMWTIALSGRCFMALSDMLSMPGAFLAFKFLIIVFSSSGVVGSIRIEL